jgi:hypothetical protein
MLVANADHQITQGLKPPCPHSILLDGFKVGRTVQFDDEPGIKAEKIGEIPINRNLPPKLEPPKPSAPQHLPKDGLGPRVGPSETPGSLDSVHGSLLKETRIL